MAFPINYVAYTEDNLVVFNQTGVDTLIHYSIIHRLRSGYGWYKLMLRLEHDEKSNCAEQKVFKYILFCANTGFCLEYFTPNEKIANMITGLSDVAITDLDKALLGCIYECVRGVISGGIDDDNAETRNLMISFVSFFQILQNYERRMKKTIDFSLKYDDKFLFQMLTNPKFEGTDTNLIDLSQENVEKLDNIISYRNQMIDDVKEMIDGERAYVSNSENEGCWELFLRYINHISKDKQEMLELSQQNISSREKSIKYDEYLRGLLDTDYKKVLDSEVTHQELSIKIAERLKKAPNYCWVMQSDRLIRVDESMIDVFVVPESFENVLISFHAFLNEATPFNVIDLSYRINRFLVRNLDTSNGYIESESDCEMTISIKKKEDLFINSGRLIFQFYETYKNQIDDLEFDCIQKEDHYSMLGFYEETEKRVVEDRKDYINERCEEFSKLDFDKQIKVNSKLEEAVFSDSSDEWYDDYYNTLHSVMPEKTLDEEKLWEQEIGKRIIVSINVIYILAKTIDKLFENKEIESGRREECINICQQLLNLEKHLIRKTYVAPDFNCFDRVDMEAYRASLGIDDVTIEKRNQESSQIALFDLAMMKIREIHEQIDDMDFSKASQLKDELRKEMSDFPDSRFKEHVIERIDQENDYLCRSLISSNSRRTDFSTLKKKMKEELGACAYRLPDETLNALTTAELLYTQYANDSYDGFDFSCISALYYQSVEAAYNKLIWTKYAERLNGLRINNRHFVDLFVKAPQMQETAGYLPDKDKAYYLTKNKKYVLLTLTMGTFMNLITIVASKDSASICHFQQHFDEVFGYKGIAQQSSEYQSFRKKTTELSSLLKIAAPKRNNASHGERAIDIETCTADRKIVLSDIDAIRNDSMGIIRLILSMYRGK